MSESRLIANLCGRLPRSLHSQSMTSASLTHNGTPDRYFDGPGGDFWIEFKYNDVMPGSGIVKGEVTKLQNLWLTRRHTNGGNVAVFVGLPNRYVAIQTSPVEWNEGTPVHSTVTYDEAAEWIRTKCGV